MTADFASVRSLCHAVCMAEDDDPEFREHVACPDCGKPVAIGKMNVCYIGRYDCPHCGAVVLIEGDKVTVEKDDGVKD